MSDLDVQIRAYIEAVSEPLTIDDVQGVPMGDGYVRPLRLVSRERGMRRASAVAAAAAVVLIVMAPVLWMAGRTEPDVGAPGPDEGVGTDPSLTVSETEPANPSTYPEFEEPAGEVAESEPVAAAPLIAAGFTVLPAEAKAELSSAILEMGEILELPVVAIHANRGDANAGMVMTVRGEFDTGQLGGGFWHRIVLFETPDAASAWLTAQTRPEDQDFLAEALEMGDESGVDAQCGRGCTTVDFVRVGAHVIQVFARDGFDAATLVEATMASLATAYAPQLELSMSTPAMDPPQPRMSWITATGESGVTVAWRVPPPEYFLSEVGTTEGLGCYVIHSVSSPDGRALVEETYHITADGTPQRAIEDGSGVRWETMDDSEAPLDDVRTLCERSIVVPAVLADEYEPSDWQIDNIVVVGDGSYTAAETTSGYRLDADQVISAGLLPADSPMTVLVAELGTDELQLVVRGGRSEVQDAFGLTFREIDTAGAITVAYVVEDG